MEDNEKIKEKKLTPKQQIFIDEYLISLNASDAALKAGYSKKTADRIGHENLKKLEIKNAIQTRLKEKESERVASQNELMEFLTRVVRGEEKDLIVSKSTDGSDSIKKTCLVKDKLKAVEILAKIHGLAVDGVNVDVEIILGGNKEDWE